MSRYSHISFSWRKGQVARGRGRFSLWAILNFQEFDTPRALCEPIFASPSSTRLNAYPESIVKLRAIRKNIKSIVKQRWKARGSIARVIRTSIVALEPRLIERGLAPKLAGEIDGKIEPTLSEIYRKKEPSAVLGFQALLESVGKDPRKESSPDPDSRALNGKRWKLPDPFPRSKRTGSISSCSSSGYRCARSVVVKRPYIPSVSFVRYSHLINLGDMSR